MILLVNTIRNKPLSILLPFIVFCISLGLRLYQLPAFIAYHEDQVRDIIFIKNQFDTHTPILLGPKASVGNFFLPPFWYYLMSFVYFFSNSPIAQALMVAAFSSLTTVLIYMFMEKFFNESSAIGASLIYALSHVSIEHSRFAWNPNPIPFFIMLTLLGLYYFLYDKKTAGLITGTVAANLALQLHYQGSIIFLFFITYLVFKRRLNLKLLAIYSLINIVLFLPFIIYELTHNFKNTQGIINFVVHNKSQRYFGIPFFIKFMISEFSLFLSSIFVFKHKIIGYILLTLLILSFVFMRPKNNKEQTLQHLILFSLILLFIYRNSLITFYLLFLIPPLIMYFVIFMQKILNSKITALLLGLLLIVSLVTSPTFAQTDKTYISLRELVNIISKEKNYCIKYDVFKETFIENKLKYLFSINLNPPISTRCEKEFLICEPAKCKMALSSFQKTVKLKSFSNHTGVVLYEVTR